MAPPPSVTSKTPKRFSATSITTSISTKVKYGFCICIPHPAMPVDSLTEINTPANTRKENNTPSPYVSPSLRTLPASSSACCTKPRIFIEITGSTHGITLRIMPPMNANNSMPQNDMASASGGPPSPVVPLASPFSLPALAGAPGTLARHSLMAEACSESCASAATFNVSVNSFECCSQVS